MKEEVQDQEAEEAGVPKRRRVVDGGDGDVKAEAEEGVGYEKGLLGDDEGGGEGIAEEAVAEVMRWLEAEIISPAPATADDDDLGFVTINGNEESCGPSFSAAASTVMASVDTRGAAPPPPPVPWPWPEPQPLRRDLDVDMEMGGSEAEAQAQEEEEWLARLLTCGPALEAEAALLA